MLNIWEKEMLQQGLRTEGVLCCGPTHYKSPLRQIFHLWYWAKWSWLVMMEICSIILRKLSYLKAISQTYLSLNTISLVSLVTNWSTGVFDRLGCSGTNVPRCISVPEKTERAIMNSKRCLVMFACPAQYVIGWI